MGLRASFLVSLALVFLIWRMGIIIDVLLEGFHDARMRVRVKCMAQCRLHASPQKKTVSLRFTFIVSLSTLAVAGEAMFLE